MVETWPSADLIQSVASTSIRHITDPVVVHRDAPQEGELRLAAGAFGGTIRSVSGQRCGVTARTDLPDTVVSGVRDIDVARQVNVQAGDVGRKLSQVRRTVRKTGLA